MAQVSRNLRAQGNRGVYLHLQQHNRRTRRYESAHKPIFSIARRRLDDLAEQRNGASRSCADARVDQIAPSRQHSARRRHTIVRRSRRARNASPRSAAADVAVDRHRRRSLIAARHCAAANPEACFPHRRRLGALAERQVARRQNAALRLAGGHGARG